ncbi:MAG: ParB/RepB/Spo0J family partition protein [bacterium]
MSKIVLGKGLQALIPGREEQTNVESGRTRMVPLDRLQPNPMQPRRDFDQAALEELAASLRRDGLMQPLVVRQNGSMFTIIAGERRFRAARLAEFREVPALLMNDVTDVRMLELALVENLQREDLNPLETAEAYRSLIDQCGLTQSELSERVGKSRAAVANQLRLLNLPESVQKLVRQGKLTEGHARALLTSGTEAEMLRLADSIMNGSLSVRDTEKRVRSGRKRKSLPRRKLPELAEAENRLKRFLGTLVRIVPGRKKGRIEIEYYSNEDLNRLLELLQALDQ